MNVLLLGAGASKAYSESPTGLRMPIAIDFFETFEKLPMFSNPWALREGIYDFLVRIKGVDPISYLSGGIDIEQLHSEVEEYLLDAIERNDRFEIPFAFRPYNELIYIFAAAVNQIQNGPISKAHIRLTAKLKATDVVVTFNWDTLMERAMSETSNWSADYGYGFSPKSVYREGWKSPTIYDDGGGFTRVIKLHGSTNWLTSHPLLEKQTVIRTQTADPETVWLFDHATTPYDCFAGRYMPGYQPFSYGYYPPNILDDSGRAAPEGFVIVKMRAKVPWKPEGLAGDSGLVSIPLIIPPVRQKKYDLYGPLFDELWEAARNAFTRASHVIIIGYSFPETDIKSAELFGSAFAGRNPMPIFSIVDPNPNPIVNKLHREFGIPMINIRIFHDYFSDEFDLDNLFNVGEV